MPFTSDNQPDPSKKKRGRDKRTLILESIREASLLDLDPHSDADEFEKREEAEKAFFTHVARSAFNQEDAARNVCLTALLDRGWSKLKPEGEKVSFSLESNDPYSMGVEVLKAVSNGELAIEQGSTLITAIGSLLKVKEIQEFEDRLKALEEASSEQD